MGMSLDSKEDIGISSKVEKFSDEVNMDLDVTNSLTQVA
jgi:hypothetical protein